MKRLKSNYERICSAFSIDMNGQSEKERDRERQAGNVLLLYN